MKTLATEEKKRKQHKAKERNKQTNKPPTRLPLQQHSASVPHASGLATEIKLPSDSKDFMGEYREGEETIIEIDSDVMDRESEDDNKPVIRHPKERGFRSLQLPQTPQKLKLLHMLRWSQLHAPSRQSQHRLPMDHFSLSTARTSSFFTQLLPAPLAHREYLQLLPLTRPNWAGSSVYLLTTEKNHFWMKMAFKPC